MCSQNKNASVRYQVEEGGQLIIHHYSINSSFSVSIHLSGENASVRYFYSTINEEDHDFSLSIFIMLLGQKVKLFVMVLM